MTRGCLHLHMSAWGSWMLTTLTELPRIIIVYLILLLLYLVICYIADTSQPCSIVSPREVFISNAAHVSSCGNFILWKAKSFNNWCVFELCMHALSHLTLAHFCSFKHMWVSASKLISSVNWDRMVAYFSVFSLSGAADTSRDPLPFDIHLCG